MSISGILVHTQPERVEPVRQALSSLPGVEVHAATAEGKLVVTVEEDDHEMGRAAMQFHTIEGVLSAAMIYHHCEEASQ